MTVPRYPEVPGHKEQDGTSQEAAEAIRGRASTLRAKVVALMLDGVGRTADEIAAELRQSVLAVRPRITELHHARLLEKTEERRKNASGMSAAVWRLS